MTIDTIIDSTHTEHIIELQSSIAHLELTVDELNTVITKQDKHIQDLQRQMQLMYSHLNMSADEGVASFDLSADRPPHY